MQNNTHTQTSHTTCTVCNIINRASCFLAIGNYYSYDIPAALHTQMEDLMSNDEKHDFETYFNLLYTCYSIPNVILPLFGGQFVDHIGPVSCILFSLLVLAGQIVFSFGARYVKNTCCTIIYILKVFYSR